MSKEEQIKRIILNKGADLCGIANIDRFFDTPSGFSPLDIYDASKSVIVFAKKLPKGFAYVNLILI